MLPHERKFIRFLEIVNIMSWETIAQLTIAKVWPVRYSQLVDRVNKYPLVRRWLNENNGVKEVKSREEIFNFLQDNFFHDEAIDYLEFGVYHGTSIRNWSLINKNPESRFFGFDTFTGLPEDWGKIRSGSYDAEGRLPTLPDQRVRFVKGLFQDTLRNFLITFERYNRMFIYIDCDLYNSTLFVLTVLDSILKKNDIIYFDEFSNVLHEFSAFKNYTESYKRKLTPLMATRLGDQLAFLVDH